jgi:hypothetical protein
MGIGSIAFNAQFNYLTEARAVVRVGRVTIDRCLCGSFGMSRTDTDQGSYEAAVASVKLEKTSWPVGVKVEGTKIDFMRVGGEWKTFRVAASSETDGILNLTLEAEYA